jgi:hypothetical protein
MPRLGRRGLICSSTTWSTAISTSTKLETLRDKVSGRSRVSKRSLDRKLKAAGNHWWQSGWWMKHIRRARIPKQHAATSTL